MMKILNFATLVVTFVLVGVQGLSIRSPTEDGEIRRASAEEQRARNVERAQSAANRDPPKLEKPLTGHGISIEELVAGYRTNPARVEMLEPEAYRWWISWMWVCEVWAVSRSWSQNRVLF